MKVLKLSLCLLVFNVFFEVALVTAAEIRSDLNVTLIPDSLKKNAYAVVRMASTEFEYKSEVSGLQTEQLILTVLDKKGKDMADFYYPGDKFHELSAFSMKLYNGDGMFLKNYSMSDVKTTEWTDSYTLADDVKRFYLNCDAPAYPFTIVCEYKISYKNGLLTFPSFFPQTSHNLSVEKAKYTLQLPEGVEYQTKAFHLTENPLRTTTKGKVITEWEVKNLMAIEDEPFDADLRTYVPHFFIRPTHFSYDNSKGIINDWKSYGVWEYELIKNRDVLTEPAREKIKELVKDATNDREKVKILYDYLGQSTRYVSIQLGIGGYQPLFASEVFKTGFGDCKALSNYLKAMLSVVGIPSYYAGIKADGTEKRLYPDFPNFNQMNHVILQVPLAADTLWLECTNPRVPFGFVHNNIAGHDALVVSESGGRMYKLPDYPDALNIESYNAKIEMKEDGSAKANTTKSCKIKVYDNYSWFPFAQPNQQVKDLIEDIHLADVTMGAVTFREDKSAFPAIDIDYAWTTSRYGTKTGNRFFVPVNPFRKTYEGLKKTGRKHAIFITNGYKDKDSIVIVVPEGYEAESIPESVKTETRFGNFISNIHVQGNSIVVEQEVMMKSGNWDVSAYPDFIAFIDKIASGYKAKTILKKKTSIVSL